MLKVNNLKLLYRSTVKAFQTKASTFNLPVNQCSTVYRTFCQKNQQQPEEIIIEPSTVDTTMTNVEEIQQEEVPEVEEIRTETSAHEFKAETRKLLDIVAKSLYTDSHVFIRELLSNASDSLEKQKYQQLTGNDLEEGDPLQISVITNEAKRQIIIQDTGIGMTKEELIMNLGTIARSGSKNFIKDLEDKEANTKD